MQLIKRVIQLAKDRALIKFSALTGMMVKDADNAIVQALAETRSGADQRNLSAALQFLRRENIAFLSRMDMIFRESVERGMRTMYTDLRQGMNNLSANSLSLIDDETVNRQLEVGHLVQRLRDACNENLGRLNIIIAQIHGDPEVHERENPFRPYLIARALYETLKETSPDEDVAKVLFTYLSDSLALHLSEFYGAICEVFEASGIQARLLARPTKLKQHQRDHLALQLAGLNSSPSSSQSGGAGGAADNQPNVQIRPSLQRMFEALQKGKVGSQNTPAQPRAGVGATSFQGSPEEFDAFVWRLFHGADGQDAADGADLSSSAFATPSPQLLSQLTQLQQHTADNDTASETGLEQNSFSALSDKFANNEVTQGERLAIDVIASLFEFILEDEQIHAGIRAQIGRLQIPFLKAAMLEPALLQMEDHPARQLLNRMSSAAVGLNINSATGKDLEVEVARLVKRILQEFDKDVAVFADCQQEFEQFLSAQLTNADAETMRSVEAAEAAEKFTVLLHNTTVTLRDILIPIHVDRRVIDFIQEIWARVLVRAALQDMANGPDAPSVSQQYRDVLPELIWSAQEKRSPEDRAALIKLLPGLIKRLRIGMLMIQMPEADCKSALDRLVPVHTQVLQANRSNNGATSLPALENLRREFSRLVLSEESVTWTLAAPIAVQEDVLGNALADRGVVAEIALQCSGKHASVAIPEVLSQFQIGTCVECRAGDTSVSARVVWVSKHQSLFIFKMAENAKPLVYSASSLMQALQSGQIRLMEYAPAFDRAVDALIMGAEALQSARR